VTNIVYEKVNKNLRKYLSTHGIDANFLIKSRVFLEKLTKIHAILNGFGFGSFENKNDKK